jgi:hypothetical protein
VLLRLMELLSCAKERMLAYPGLMAFERREHELPTTRKSTTLRLPAPAFAERIDRLEPMFGNANKLTVEHSFAWLRTLIELPNSAPPMTEQALAIFTFPHTETALWHNDQLRRDRELPMLPAERNDKALPRVVLL